MDQKAMLYKTIRVNNEGDICYIQFDRESDKNTINQLLIEECLFALKQCRGSSIKIVVLKSSRDIFCNGADFNEMLSIHRNNGDSNHNPEPLYQLWEQLSFGPFITIAQVRGIANAGGIGFVSACDIVLADESAKFGLSELLFGVFPACVMPFLLKRVGYQKAHQLTLMTKPINVETAKQIGLVDDYEIDVDRLLKLHLRRLTCLSRPAIKRYKEYMSEIHSLVHQAKQSALKANQAIFSDKENLQAIFRFVETGQFPWES
jgi:3-carboxymethyl-3-hydroxy-acyl-[acp] dehydratase